MAWRSMKFRLTSDAALIMPAADRRRWTNIPVMMKATAASGRNRQRPEELARLSFTPVCAHQRRRSGYSRQRC